jgi:hypothetical protein
MVEGLKCAPTPAPVSIPGVKLVPSLLAPGQLRESAIFEPVRECGFHDHLDQMGGFGRSVT